MELVGQWGKVFMLTLALEMPIVALLFRTAEPRLARRLALIFFANLATHPAVWFIIPEFGLDYRLQVGISELWAWGIEAAFYFVVFARASFGRAAGVSFLANAFSAGTGLLLRALTGWI